MKKEWSHLHDIDLADPGFGCPGKIDMLLGIDIFVEAILHGRRGGPTGRLLKHTLVGYWLVLVTGWFLFTFT